MLEIVIERWTDAKGKTDFLWSAWEGGKRLTMGPQKYASADEAEAAARAFCANDLGRPPDRVTRL